MQIEDMNQRANLLLRQSSDLNLTLEYFSNVVDGCAVDDSVIFGNTNDFLRIHRGAQVHEDLPRNRGKVRFEDGAVRRPAESFA